MGKRGSSPAGDASKKKVDVIDLTVESSSEEEEDAPPKRKCIYMSDTQASPTKGWVAFPRPPLAGEDGLGWTPVCVCVCVVREAAWLVCLPFLWVALRFRGFPASLETTFSPAKLASLPTEEENTGSP